MPDANVLPDATTTDGAFLVLAIVLPATGVLLSFVLGGRYAERLASVLLPPASSLRPSFSSTCGEAATG